MTDERFEAVYEETKARAQELKPCVLCVHKNADCTYCFENKIQISPSSYGCRKHMTDEEQLRKNAEEEYAKQIAIQKRMLLELDIMSYEIGAAQQTLEKLDAELCASYNAIKNKDKECIDNHNESKKNRDRLAKAFVQLKAHAQDMRNTYNRYVEYFFNTLFTDENGKYNWKESDKNLVNTGVINTFVRVLVDKTLENGENAEAIMDFMLSLKGSGIYNDKQLGKFMIRR